ncbi:MAG: putative spermidine/putrescine transport system substrate-binding protein, partial [Solirubrobacteraceae bacterium]|nr:putative spermidine/putrescine transport system substrate-binding protein [Solirubrobacteraceae bacterium]
MRTFLRLTMLVTVSCWVVACGSDSDKKGGTAATGPDISGKGEGRLNIVNWEGYADPTYVKAFERQSGCKVNSVPAGTSDEMFTKFRSGGGGQYDLVSPSGDASLRLIKSG